MPVANVRVAVNWDDSKFINYAAVPADALNIMHNTYTNDPEMVNLHWNVLDVDVISGATAVKQTAWTDYGLRQLHCVTGTNTGAGASFAWKNVGGAQVVVNSGQPYTAVMWIKASVGSGTSMKMDMVNSTASVTFSISGSWQKITTNFTPSTNRTGFKIYKNSSATNVTFDVAGFMIVAGSSAPGGFNTGTATCRYDVLPNGIVKKWTVKIGQRDWTKRWLDEGTADITINNFGRLYSPEYSSGPLYGVIGAKRLLTVDIMETGGSTWTRIFTGWIQSMLPNPIKTGHRDVNIKAVQGRFQLDKIPFNELVSGSATVDSIIEDVLLAGFVSAATPIQANAGFAKAGACYASDTAAMYALDTGVSEIPLNPEGWGGDVSASRVLQDLLEVEQGFFFIDRGGKVFFFNRHHYSDPALAPTPTSIDLDAQSTENDYEFGKPFYNHAKVSYHPPSTLSNQTVWESRVSLKMRPGKPLKMVAKLEYTEGKKMTVTQVNGFDGGVNDSTMTITAGSASAASKLKGTVKLKNGQATIEARNGSTGTVMVYFILKGTVQESQGGNTIELTTDAPGVGGPETLKKDMRQIATEDEARNFAAYMLDLFRGAIGQVPSFRMLSRDASGLNTQLAIALGDQLTITQYQTGHTGSYAVVGEDHMWSAEGILESTYYLFPLHRLRDLWILGTSELGSDTYLAY